MHLWGRVGGDPVHLWGEGGGDPRGQGGEPVGGRGEGEDPGAPVPSQQEQGL